MTISSYVWDAEDGKAEKGENSGGSASVTIPLHFDLEATSRLTESEIRQIVRDELTRALKEVAHGREE